VGRASDATLPQEESMSLRINDIAPDFEADTTQGRIRFHDWSTARLKSDTVMPAWLNDRAFNGLLPADLKVSTT
jgi:hypothetical protein